jgi:hypothetical protein
MPHAKVFEQVGIPLTLRILVNFLQFFRAQFGFFIDLRLSHDKRIKKIYIKERHDFDSTNTIESCRMKLYKSKRVLQAVMKQKYHSRSPVWIKFG